MVCPDCGYALSAFDKECPRCEKTKDKSLQNPYVRHQEALAAEQALPVIKPVSALDYLELDAAPAQHDRSALSSGDQATFCVHCGTRLAPQGRFCAKCGQPAAVSDDATEAARPKPQEFLSPVASVRPDAEFHAPLSQPSDLFMRSAAPTPTSTSTQVAIGIFTGVLLLFGVLMVIGNLIAVFTPKMNLVEVNDNIKTQELSGYYADPLEEKAERKAAQDEDTADEEASLVRLLIGGFLTVPFLVVRMNSVKSSVATDTELSCLLCRRALPFRGAQCPHCSSPAATPSNLTTALGRAGDAVHPMTSTVAGGPQIAPSPAGAVVQGAAGLESLTPAPNSGSSPVSAVATGAVGAAGDTAPAPSQPLMPPPRQPRTTTSDGLTPSRSIQQDKQKSTTTADSEQAEDKEPIKSKVNGAPVRAGVLLIIVTLVIGVVYWLVKAKLGSVAAQNQLAQARVCLTQAQAATTRFQVATLTPSQADALLQSGAAQYQAVQKWSRAASHTSSKAATKLQQAGAADCF